MKRLYKMEADKSSRSLELICLNTWGGKLFDPLIEFFRKHAKDIDIFCLQEVFDSEHNGMFLDDYCVNLFSVISELLPDFNGYFAPAEKCWDRKRDIVAPYGLATFIKKSFVVEEQGDIFIYKHRYATPHETTTFCPHAKNMQYTTVQYNGRQILVANMHGLYIDDGKEDIPERIEQSKRINAFMSTKCCPKVLCGDFNLSPNTKSVSMLEKGMRNLNKEYHVRSTRDDDYVLVSPEIKIKDFKVLQEQVSDHLPLYLEFDVGYIK